MRGFDYAGGYRYHVVFLTDRRRPHLRELRWASLVVLELGRVSASTGFALGAFCVMPDHVHVLLRGDAALKSDLKKFAHSFKQSLGFQFRQTEGVPLWHRSYYDHVLRSDELAIVHAAYIVGNPVRAGLVALAAQWPYSGPPHLFLEAGEADRSKDPSLRVDQLTQEMQRLFAELSDALAPYRRLRDA